jgi:hypothetical protein
LELFPTSQAALKWQDYLRSNADSEDGFGDNLPLLFRGRQLLDLLSYADIVEFIDDDLNCISHYLTPRATRVRAAHEPENTLKTWYIDDWPPYVVPGNPSRGRQLMCSYLRTA